MLKEEIFNMEYDSGNDLQYPLAQSSHYVDEETKIKKSERAFPRSNGN